MHFRRMKGPSLARTKPGTIFKRAQLILLLCGLLGIALVLHFSGRTIANADAAHSNQNEQSEGRLGSKVPAGMVWIASGIFMMGTNDERSFPNERPAHLR